MTIIPRPTRPSDLGSHKKSRTLGTGSAPPTLHTPTGKFPCPINALPTELLLRIFHLARESPILTLPPRSTSCLWALRRVCQKWRHIIIGDFSGVYLSFRAFSKEDVSTSSLLQTLELTRAAIVNCASRKTISLKLRIDEESLRLNNSILPIRNLISPTLPRIAHLSLTLGWPAVRELLTLPPGSLISTTSFKLHFHSLPPPADRLLFSETRIFEGARALRHLQISHHGKKNYDYDIELGGGGSIPWSQLTEVVLDSPEGAMISLRNAYRILMECRSLVRCFMNVIPPERPSAGDGVGFGFGEVVHLPRLRVLNLNLTAGGGDEMIRDRFLDHLDMPRLNTLWVDGVFIPLSKAKTKTKTTYDAHAH